MLCGILKNLKMLHFNSHHHPDELPDEYDNIFVQYSHIHPRCAIGGASKSQLELLQKQSVNLDRGLNTKFGTELAEILLHNPVFFTTQHNESHFSPDPYSTQEISTYNTGTTNLYRNEHIAVVPPMCNCDTKNKIKGNVIPLQTVLRDKYNADLNEFLDWVKSVTLTKKYLKGLKSTFSHVFDILSGEIQKNSLVKDMLHYITVPDGCQLTKLEILYDVANKYWIVPLLGNNGLGYDGQTSLIESITIILSVLDATAKYRLELCTLLENGTVLTEEMQKNVNEKLKATTKEILKIPKYLTMLRKYNSPVNVPSVGILSTTFATHGDPFITKPKYKMNLIPVYEHS